jgi:N-acetylmuramoyl-L-alanine amidase
MSWPRATLAIAEARIEMAAPASAVLSIETPPARVAKAEAAPAMAALPLTGVSIARQLGLGVSRIVIDAGHGGHDPGAKGKGVTEAELVLDVALRVEKLLSAIPGVEVILTRRDDAFIPLQERTAIANREGADLFLSIHANASPNAQARGIETYFLNFANNLSAAAVAARENAASGQAMAALPDFVKAIALNNKLDESRDFATQVQRSMMDKLRGTNKTVRDLGVKQAPFVVLIGAAMPSVLAEISFVTNPQEAKLLKSNAYRQKIADALVSAVQRYQTSLKKVQAVAQQ